MILSPTVCDPRDGVPSMVEGPLHEQERSPAARVADRLRGRIHHHHLLMAVAALAVLLPVLWTPYSGDDIINSGLPAVMSDADASRWDVIRKLTTEWMNFQGRFFPGAVAYGVMVFTVFTSRIAYKAYLLVLWMAVIAALWAWIARLFRDHSLGFVVGIGAVGTLAFRYPYFHDGVSAYAGLLPWALLLLTAVLALTVRRPSSRTSMVVGSAVLVWALVLVTYEVVVLLVPIVVVSVLLGSPERSWRRTVWLALGVPLIASLMVTSLLRARLHDDPAPGYRIHLDVADVPRTIAKQLLASLPLGQFWLPRAAMSWPRIGLVALCVGTVAGLAAYAGLLGARPGRSGRATSRQLVWLVGLGCWMWVAPALLVGITLRWQYELPWGEGYLSMVFSSVGVVMMLAAAHQWAWSCPSGATASDLRRLGQHLVTLAIAATVAATAAVNVAFVRDGLPPAG
jgi:hypothetical protein